MSCKLNGGKENHKYIQKHFSQSLSMDSKITNQDSIDNTDTILCILTQLLSIDYVDNTDMILTHLLSVNIVGNTNTILDSECVLTQILFIDKDFLWNVCVPSVVTSPFSELPSHILCSWVNTKCHCIAKYVKAVTNMWLLYKNMRMSYTCRNGMNVEGATHKQVVDYIRSGGDSLTLTGMILIWFVSINL